MVKLVNRAKMTIASGGAGNITLGTAVDGYQTFADAGVSDADTLRYTIEDGDDWEIGTGVYTASGTTLARTVTESSNSDAALNCSGDAIIFITIAAEDLAGNAAPMFTNPLPAGITLEKDGTTATVIDGRALDDNGFPITYSWDGFSGTTYYDDANLPPQLQSAPTINQTTGAVSVIGSSDILDAGTFNLRIKASDGVRTSSMSTAAKLSFLYETGMVAYYDAGDPASYNGTGSTWSDLSGNGYHLTLATDGSMVYNSSGTGSKPSFTLGQTSLGANAFEQFSSTHNYSGSGNVFFVAIMRFPYSQYSGGSTTTAASFLGRPSSSDPAVAFYDCSTSTSRNTWSMPNGNGAGTGSVANVASPGTQGFSDFWVDGTQLPELISNIAPRNESMHIAFELDGSSNTTAPYSVDTTKRDQYHSLMIDNVRLDTGIRASHDAAKPNTGIELRAMIIYDHEPTNANRIAIHNVFKGIYGSDMASAP